MDNLTDSNITTLSNAIELAGEVISKVVGEEVANTLHGERVSNAQIKDAVAARMQSVLVNKSGVL
jgi:hypothetical protein